MKTITILLLLVPNLAWSLCDDWTRTDTNTALVFSGTVAADLYTTKRVLEDGGYETNPLLGKHPSDQTLALAGAAAISGYLVGACLLPQPWRERWGWFWIGVETSAASWNYLVSAMMRF